MRYRTEDGSGWYEEPPYTEAEEREFYRRQGVVGVLRSDHRPLPDPQPQPHKSPPPPPAK
jgi:hypothetical protein